MSDTRVDQIQHWLSVAEDENSQEKELAARYAAAASARLWILAKLDGDSGDAPDSWGQVRELAEEADNYLDDDRQDEALYRRAQANLLALKLFEDSDESQRPTNGNGRKSDDEKSDKTAKADKSDDSDDDSDADKDSEGDGEADSKD